MQRKSMRAALRLAGRVTSIALASYLLAGVSWSTTANAAGYPERTIRYVVPFSPGGLTDNAARLVGHRVSEAWGQPVVIDNKPGANANLGADLVAKSSPDGYTWLAMTLTHAANVSLFPKLPFSLQKDLAPVARLASSTMAVVVPAGSLIRSLGDLVEEAKKRPLSAGSSGNGTPPHLTLALFESQTKTKLVHVPYKGGAPSIADLIGAQIDVVFSNLPESLPHIQSGKLRALAVTAAARDPLLPNVPTTAEAGLPDLVVENWTGLMVPAGTPMVITDRIADAAIRALDSDDMRRRLTEMGFTPAMQPREAFARYLDGEIARWGKIIEEQRIRPE